MNTAMAKTRLLIVGALLLSKAPAALLTELFYGVMMFAGIKMLFGA